MTAVAPFPRFDGFTYSPALGPEEGVTRRDPSPVIRIGDLYYAWYSRTETSPDGYSATLWWATSPDGHAWYERGEALGRGPAAAKAASQYCPACQKQCQVLPHQAASVS